MKVTRTENSIKNSGATIFGRFATLMMEFVLRTVLIRILGVEYAGVSSLFTDILQVLSLMELGLGNAIVFALYKPIAEQNHKKINALMRFYRVAYNAIAAGIFLLGLMCVPVLGYIVKDVPDIKESIQLVFMLYVVASSCSYLVAYKETLIKASQQSRVVVKIEMIVQLIFMGLEAISLVIFRQFLIYLILRIVTSLARNIMVSREVKKRFPDVNYHSKERLSRDDKKTLAKDIGAMALYKISGVVLNGTGSVIISAFLGTAVVGVIGQYRMISNFVSNLCNKVWNTVLPSVGNLAAEENDGRQYQVFRKVNFGSFFVSAFCSVALLVLVNPFVALWVGSEYTVSMATVFAISLNMYLFLTILPFQTFRDANGLFVQGKYRPVIMAAINLAMQFAFAQWWGLFGVMLATPIARILTQAWFDPYVVYKYVFKRSPVPYYIEFLKHFLVTCVCGGLTYVLYNLCSVDVGVLNLMIGAVLCVIIPLLVYGILFCKDPEFRYLLAFGKQFVFRVLRKLSRKKGGK